MVILGLRAVQLLFAIIIMGLSAYVANWYNVDTLTSSPSQINWLLFSSIYTIISVAYLELAPRFMPRGWSTHPCPSPLPLSEGGGTFCDWRNRADSCL